MMLYFPKQGFFKRMRIYFLEMHPIPVRLAESVLLYLSFVAFLRRLHGVQSPIFSLYTLLGIWNIFALMLILRLMDELKDKEIDQDLFHDRPLPSGKVLESDISFSLVLVIALYLVSNMWSGSTFWMALFVLGYALLMFKYFFIPHIMRKNLLLTLITHNPIIPIMLFYILILFSYEQNIPLSNLNLSFSFLLVAMYWAVFFAWEIARKIRSSEEENEYVTYSQIFGRFGAVLVAGGVQTIAFGIGLYFYWKFDFSGIFLVIWLAGYGMTMWGHARFLFSPTPVTSKLKPFAERYILIVLIANILERSLYLSKGV